jgi:DNA-binding SARP family transcriptional activator
LSLLAVLRRQDVPVQSLRVRLLGELQVEGCDPKLLGRRQLRTLLKILALRHDRPVSTDTLAECIWSGDPPEHAADQVSVLVSRLRRVTGSDRIRRTDGGYELSVDWLDLDDLASRADEADHRLAQGAVVAARAAAAAGLSLVRGPLLADESDPTWASAERAQSEQVIIRLHRAAMQGAAAARDWRGAEQRAVELLTTDPFDESALYVLMEALARSGRAASALARYAEQRRRVGEELGIDLSARIEELHTAILLDELPALAADSPPSSESAIPPGRTEQFAELNRLLTQVVADGCRVAVVTGEPGMGKSHLLEAWTQSLDRLGSRVVAVACDELGQSLSLQPLFDAVSNLAAQMHGDGADMFAADDAILRPFLDVGWQPTDATQLAVLTDPGAGQSLLFGALRSVLRNQALGGPLVIVVDDLHLADPATVRWLGQAPRHLGDVPLLFVGAMRSEEAVAIPGATYLELDPMELDAVAQVVGPDRAPELLQRSGGNALFLVELAASQPGTELPESIRHAVNERCERAGPAAATLRAAAVIGPEFDLDLLNAVTGLPVADLLDHLEEGVRRRLLLEVGPGFAFTHALVREALASSVGAARSAFIHRQSARALAARPLTDPVDLARHARLGGELAEASAMLVDAARQAVGRFDRDEALRLVTEAIAVHASAPALLERARIQSVLGRYVEAAQDIEAAEVLGGGGEALEVAAWSAHFQRRFGEAMALADRGVVAATTEEVRRGCQSLGGWVALVSGDPRGAERRLEGAIGVAPAGNGGLTHSWLALLRVNQGRAAEALALARPDEVKQDASQGLDVYRFPNAYALMAAVMAHATLGQPDRALRALDELEADIARMGAQRWVPRPMNLRSWLARNLGEFEQADELNQAAMAASQGPGMVEPLANAVLDLASGHLLRGDIDRARASVHEAHELGATEHAFRWRHQLRTRLLGARCDLAADDATKAAEDAMALGRDARDLGVPRYEVQADLVRVMAEQQLGVQVDRTEVDGLLRRLDELAGLEAWWITAEAARAFSEPKWEALARSRVAALVQRAGRYAPSLERVAQRTLADR